MESIIAQIAAKFKFSKGGEMRGKNDFEKLNDFILKGFWIFFCTILVSISFFLGRVTKFLEQEKDFTFEQQATIENTFIESKNQLFKTVSTSTIVASSGGKKYYFVWCKGASNLKEKNKRYFQSEEAVQKAGYTLASGCK